MNDLEQYYRLRPLIDTGDIITYQSATALGWLIQKFTGADENHIGGAIRFRQYDRDRIYTLEALEGGFVLRALSDRLQGHKGRAWWHRLKPEFHHNRDLMGCLALGYVGTKYDYGSLFKQALGRVSADASRLFCSEAWQLIATMARVMEPTELALQPKHYRTEPWLEERRQLVGKK